MMPTASAVSQSISLLNAFVQTNGPSALFRAIPAYKHTKGGVAFADAFDTNDDVQKEMQESRIGRMSGDIGKVKDCWGLLEKGLVRRDGESESSDEDEEEDGTRSVVRSNVGRHSWPLLEVLVTALEEDERRNNAANQCQCFPLD